MILLCLLFFEIERKSFLNTTDTIGQHTEIIKKRNHIITWLKKVILRTELNEPLPCKVQSCAK